MPRALLINPPGTERYLRDYFCSTISKAGYYWQPTDLLMLSGFLADAGYELLVLDCIASELDEPETLRRAADFAPDAILGLTSAAAWQEDFPFYERLHQRVPDATMLVSGEVFLDRAVPILEANPHIAGCWFDFTCDDPVRFLAGDHDVSTMAYRDGDQIVMKRHDPRSSFRVPVPRHEAFPLARYNPVPGCASRKWTSLLTNYGCPFPCDFCNSCTYGFKWREADNLDEECQHLKALGIRHCFVRDMTFAARKAHGLEMLEVLERYPFTYNGWCRVDLIDEELADRMAAAGFVLLQFGVESGSAEILNRNGKRYAPEQVDRAFNILADRGIAAGAHFVLGLPGETEDTLEETIALATRLPALYASFNVFAPRHGTPLREEAIARGLIDETAHADSSLLPPMVSQAGLSPEVLARYKKLAYRRFYLRPGYFASHLSRPRTWLNHTRLGLGVVRNMIAV